MPVWAKSHEALAGKRFLWTVLLNSFFPLTSLYFCFLKMFLHKMIAACSKFKRHLLFDVSFPTVSSVPTSLKILDGKEIQ